MRKSNRVGGAFSGSWSGNSKGWPAPARRALAGATAFVLAGIVCQQSPAATVNAVWNDGAGDNLWSDLNNWTPAAVPNNGTNTYNVSISIANPCNLNISPVINNLMIGSSGVLNIQAGSTLTLNGPSLNNSGQILVNSNQQSSLADLAFGATTTISGSGSIVLNNNGGNAELSGASSVAVTQSAGHTINGFGVLSLDLVNNGTVNANGYGQTLYVSGVNETNNALMEATGNGTLAINGITLSQGAGGNLLASGGNVSLTSATVIGGSLQSSSGTFSASGTTTLSAVTIAAGTNLSIPGTGFVNVSGGTLTNKGTITVDDNGGSQAFLNFTSNTLLTGTGAVLLNDYSPRAVLNAPSGVVVTVDTNQLIHGNGDIDAAIINNGTINADAYGQTINLQTANITNNNLIEATGNGGISINGITITQGTHGSTSGVIAANGGNVSLNTGTTVSLGTLASFGGSGIYTAGTTTLNNVTLTSGSNLYIGAAATVNISGGTLTNNGTITVDNNGGSPAFLNFTSTTLLTGTGAVLLNDYSPRAVLNAPSGAVVTVDTNQLIHGNGDIDAAIINNGTINADAYGQTINLQTANITNNNLIEATGNGGISINGITVTQGTHGSTNGVIAANGGNVSLTNGANISQGTIISYGGYGIYTSGTTTLNNVTLTSGSNLYIGAAATVNISGGMLTNNGTITVDNNGGSPAFLNFTSTTLLTGTGAVILNDYSPRAVLNAPSGAVVTVDTNQLIHGTGDIDAPITNYGTINADYYGQTLNLQAGNMTNDNLMEATNNGGLSINGIAIAQGTHGSTSGAINASGGNVSLTGGATIIGGTLNAASNNGFYVTNTTASLTNVNISTGTNVYINGTGILTLNPGTITNNGTIRVSDNGGSVSVLQIGGNVSLAGAGTIELYNSADDARIITAASATLTVGASQTIDGWGDIDASLINNGIINANAYGLVMNLNTAPGQFTGMTNNNLVEATSNGSLDINQITLSQSAGAVLEASGSSSIVLNGATVSGGILTTTGGATIYAENSNFINSPNISSGSSVQIPSGYTLTIVGPGLINNGTIQIQTNGGGISYLNFNTSTSVSGTGTIFLDDNSDDARITTSLGATLTLGAGQTVDGFGDVDAVVVNNGSIIANAYGQAININPSPNGSTGITNNGLFEASNNGTLNITANLLTNFSGTTLTGGTYEVAGGTINLPGSIVTNAATIILNGGYNFTALAPLATNTGSFILENGATFSTVGTLVSSGTINNSGGLTVNGAFNQTAGTTLNYGSFAVTGSTNIGGGSVNIEYGGSFSGSPIVIGAGAQLLANGSLLNSPVVTDNGTVIFGANANAGYLVRTLASLGIGGNASTSVAVSANTSSRTLIVTSALNIAGTTNAWTGKLDLGNNDLDVIGGSLATITSQIAQGYNSGKWNGAGGIASTAAAANIAHTTALGVIQNNQGGAALYTASNPFDGTTPGVSDILVKYTYYGDTDLNGKVDGSDYSRIDAAYLADKTHPGTDTGWFNGDFNYDGVINGSDYTLIDNSFNRQGAQISAEVAGSAALVAGTSAVPEPASLAVIGLGGAMLLGRRSRKLHCSKV
jgi:filamentous hemagglutinin